MHVSLECAQERQVRRSEAVIQLPRALVILAIPTHHVLGVLLVRAIGRPIAARQHQA